MKKAVSILVVLAMLLSMCPSVFAVDTSDTTVIASGTDVELETIDEAYGQYESIELEWTAPADGVVTVHMMDADPGWAFTITDLCGLESNDDESNMDQTYTYEVRAGATHSFSIFCYYDWSQTYGTISYEVTFTPGEISSTTEKETYVISSQTLSVGENTVALEANAENSLYEFTPEEAGVYTFTVPEGYLLGFWGTSAYAFDATADKTNTLSYTVREVGPSILFGIVNGEHSGEVVLRVEKTGDATVTEIPVVTYVNKTTPAAFTLPEGYVVGDYVNVYDEVAHTAVLGDDGYYHLDSADGDILLVDLNYKAPLTAALGSERPVMHAYVTDDDGNTVMYDIGAAAKAYVEASDEDGYYPLTEDLMFFYQVYGKDSGTISFALQDDPNYNEECAWMFACLTMSEDAPELEPEPGEILSGSGTEGDPYVISGLPVDLELNLKSDNGGKVYYLYTAEKDGIIEIKDLYETTNHGTVYVYVNDGERIWLNEGEICSVKEGDKVLIYHWHIFSGNYNVTLQFAAQSGDDSGDTGGDSGDTGDEPIPDSGEWIGANVEVAADESIVVIYTPVENGVLSVDVLCQTGWKVTVMSEFDEEAYWSDTAESPVEFNLVAGTTYTISIDPYDEADGFANCDAVMTYQLTFTPERVVSDATDDNILYDGDNYLYMDNTDGACTPIEYTYIATQTGTLYLTTIYVACDSGSGMEDETGDIVGVFDADWGWFEITVNGVKLASNYYGSIEVQEGDEIIVTWCATDNFHIEYQFEVILNLNYDAFDLPAPGSAEAPYDIYSYEIEEFGPTTVQIPANEVIYCNMHFFEGCYITVTGEGAYVIYNGTVYTAEDGVITLLSDSREMQIRIGNDGDASDSFQVGITYPVGSEKNPDELTNGQFKHSFAPDNSGYYYELNALCNGSVTVTLGGSNWWYYVEITNPDGSVTYGDYHYATQDNVATQTVMFEKGAKVLLYVGTYDNYTSPAGVVTLDAQIVYNHEADGEGIHTDATCTEDGYTTYTCKHCGESYSIVDETASGHNFVDGVCTECGELDAILGDVNGDNVVNQKDATWVLKYSVKLVGADELNLAVADVNGDNVVNQKDATWILKYAVKLVTEFPASSK